MEGQLNIPLVDVDELKKVVKRVLSDTIEKLWERQVVFIKKGSVSPIGGWEPKSFDFLVQTIPESKKKTQLAALDSTCISIASTDDGTVFAFRASAVFAYEGSPRNYLRLGPILVYIEPSAIARAFRSGSLIEASLTERLLVQQMIRVRLERVVAQRIAEGMSDEGMLLLDGSLRVSSFDTAECGLDVILDVAKRRRVDVVGVSKTSNIGLLNNVMGLLWRSKSTPVYVDVDEAVKAVAGNLRGKVLVARLSQDGQPLRIDVWSHGSLDHEVLSRLISSDIIAKGYPESLRLAHHLSVFTPVEAACIKSYLAKEKRLLEAPSEDLRVVLLGRILVSKGKGGL